MPFKNKRNSRDDKSEKSTRTSRPASGSSSKSNSYKSDRPEGTNSTRKKLFSDDSKRPFKSGFKKADDKSGSGFSSEKRSPKSFGRSAGSDERRSSAERPERKPFADRTPGEKRPYSDRGEGGRKTFGDRAQGDRKPWSGTNETEKKPFAGRESKFSDKKAPVKSFNDKPFK